MKSRDDHPFDSIDRLRATMRSFVAIILTLGVSASLFAYESPDISTVDPDLTVPAMTIGTPTAGKRVRYVTPGYETTDVHSTLYLPTDWDAESQFPVIVEFAGNGPYRNGFGDISTGVVDGSRMGFGLTEGKRFLWLCLPYLNNAGTQNRTQWWGDPPEYDVQPTIDHTIKTVRHICRLFNGDSKRVVLVGFSRGAIACNFIGLHNDEIAKLWCAFIPFSHYDGGLEGWPYPGSDRASATVRLKRLGNRPQFILAENAVNLELSRAFIESTGLELRITYRSTGFRNHNDAWLIRPSESRKAVRAWLSSVVSDE